MNYILSDSPKWNQIKYFGRIKRYSLFYHEVLSRLTSRQKITVVKRITTVPRILLNTIARIFALKDILSHVYTFDYTNKRALQYKGMNVLAVDGFKSYLEDSHEVIVFLVK